MLRRLLILTCFFGSVFYTVTAKKQKITPQSNKQQAKIDYKETGAPLPPIKVYTREGKYITDEGLKNDANLFVMLFNPTCEHCEDQTRLLKDNINLFEQSNLVLMAAPSMIPYLEYFMNNTGSADIPRLQIGVDSAGYIDKTFLYHSLPQLNIYDKERKLIRIYTGFTPLDSLRTYIE